MDITVGVMYNGIEMRAQAPGHFWVVAQMLTNPGPAFLFFLYL